MKFLLPALAFLMAATSFAETSVTLDIVKHVEEKNKLTMQCPITETNYDAKPKKTAKGYEWPEHTIKKPFKGFKNVVTGYDAQGLARVRITHQTLCSEDIESRQEDALDTETRVELIAKSGEVFAQPDIDLLVNSYEGLTYDAIQKRQGRIDDLKKYLGRASERCPLSLVVGGEGAYKKHEFNCKVFSEDSGADREMRMESGELLDAPAT